MLKERYFLNVTKTDIKKGKAYGGTTEREFCPLQKALKRKFPDVELVSVEVSSACIILKNTYIRFKLSKNASKFVTDFDSGKKVYTGKYGITKIVY